MVDPRDPLAIGERLEQLRRIAEAVRVASGENGARHRTFDPPLSVLADELPKFEIRPYGK